MSDPFLDDMAEYEEAVGLVAELKHHPDLPARCPKCGRHARVFRRLTGAALVCVKCAT